MNRVLIADDEPIERAVIKEIIENEFKDTITLYQAVNGREVIDMFRRYQPQILLLDIEMPGINGLEAAAEIRKISKSCVIIFLTAFDEFNYAKKAISVQALDYILKPSTEEEIIYAMEEAIHQINIVSMEIEAARTEDVTDYEQQLTEELFKDYNRTMLIKEEILRYIEQNYMNEISLQDAAEYMNYCTAYFCKLFKQEFSKSFTTYLAEYRIEEAKKLLCDITSNVKDISEKIGYRDSNYFTKVFKRAEGMTPTEYRMKELGKLL
ncbi:MAG: response regulator [Lachnospiraceae bacterium]